MSNERGRKESGDDVQERRQVLGGMLAGAVAGVASRLVIFPFDTLKARLQVQGALGSERSHSLMAAGARMLSTEGFGGFYRGFGAVVLGIVPAQAAYFGGYELGRSMIPEHWGVWRDVGTGCVAQLLAGVAFTPIDVVKERLQCRTLPGASIPYSNALSAVASVIRSQGLAGLMRGYWATNGVWLPWNVIYVASYEHTKRLAASCLQPEEDAASQQLPAWAVPLCSGSSAAFAGLLTHPADVVKTRIQVLSASTAGSGGGAALTFWAAAQQMAREEGAGAFSRGLSARLLTLAPGSALSWMVYELIKARYL